MVIILLIWDLKDEQALTTSAAETLAHSLLMEVLKAVMFR